MSGPAVQESVVTRSAAPRSRPKGKLGFGKVFTDHMFLMNFDEHSGWHAARIERYQPLKLDPATAYLHYGQGLFEGLKAFRGVDDKIRLFRPEMHAERLVRTAQTLCIPPIDPAALVRSWTSLIEVDHAWIPEGIGKSLYIRPVIIASDRALGIRPSSSYLYFVILSPVDSYYGEEMTPLRINITRKYARTVSGGLGSAKTPANYAASLRAADEARRDGFAQVLWLDGVHRKYIEEVGTMNFMAVIENQVVTPPAGDTILAGVTRDSVLQLLKDWGVRVSERALSVDELLSAGRRGLLSEAWGTGTAAMISPIGELSYEGERVTINSFNPGPLTRGLYEALRGIQYGFTSYKGWTVEIPLK